MKNYLPITVLLISLLGCASPRTSVSEQVQEDTHLLESTADSLHSLLQQREQQIRELRLQLSATEKRAEQSERIIKEYDAHGNLLKTDESRTHSTTEKQMQAALSEKEAKMLEMEQEIVGLREALTAERTARQTSTDITPVVYKVPAWCRWLLLANVLYVAGRILWAIYGKKFLQIFKTIRLCQKRDY